MFTYLISCIPPGHKGTARFYTQAKGKPSVHHRASDALAGSEPVITFDLDILVEHLRKNNVDLPVRDVVDIRQLAKQAAGVPRKELRGDAEEPWSAWNLVREWYETEPEQLRRATDVYYGLSAFPGNQDADKIFTTLVRHFAEAGDRTLEALKSAGEWERFQNLELPVQQVCTARSYGGVHFRRKGLSELIIDLHHRVYQRRNVLQLEYRIMSRRDTSRVKDALRLAGYEYVALQLGSPTFPRTLKAHATRHPLLDTLHQEQRDARDKATLVRLGAHASDVFYPSFETMGTVTGRITVSDPHVQNLSREHRGLIQAAPECALVYIDYDQFEARILADESGDGAFIADINRGRFYQHLGYKVFNRLDQEDFSKRLFYRYCYGSRGASLENFLQELDPTNSADAASKVRKVFQGYPGVVEIFRAVEEELTSARRIGTRLGNYRYWNAPPATDEAPPSWGLSQRIQGTASVILKRAILAAVREPGVEFLLPMHDAALFQVPATKLESTSQRLVEVFETAQREVCPRVTPSARIAQFAT